MVAVQVGAGERYLEQLRAAGFPVHVAFWAQPSEQRWYLYLATPIVDEKGALEAYRALINLERQLDDVGVDSDEVRVVATTDTMAVAAAKLIEPKPGRTKPPTFVTRYYGSRLGGIDVDGVLVYPPRTAPAS